MKTNCLILLFALILLPASSRAQQPAVYMDNQGYTAQQMITDFFDSSYVSVSNISYQGDSLSISFFDASGTNLGMNAGLFLCSGGYVGKNLPNSSGGNTTGQISGMGDSDLDSISQTNTFDAAVVEFDFVCSKDTAWFKYIFASEEYMEFVNSGFNDVFGFFITGLKPGGGSYNHQNIALIPNTNLPVGIDNLNCNLNSSYYVCNEESGSFSCSLPSCPTSNANTLIEFDGYTLPMYAYVLTVPYQSYHVKLGVADAGDHIFDSGLFLDVESLGGGYLKVKPNVWAQNITGGSLQFVNKTLYATQHFWDFGDGYTSTDKSPQHTFANFASQNYTIKYVAKNYCSSDTLTFSSQHLATIQPGFESIAELSPNPANNSFWLRTSLAGYAMRLEDLQGRTLWESEGLVGDIEVDTRQFTAGLYLLRLSHGNRLYTAKCWISH